MSEIQLQQNENMTQDTKSLSLQDLLVDEQANILSDYLSVSLSSIGDDAQVSFTTTDAVPVTYSSVLYGVSATEIHSLLVDAHHINTDI